MFGTCKELNPKITSTQYSALRGSRMKNVIKPHNVLKSGNKKIILRNELTFGKSMWDSTAIWKYKENIIKLPLFSVRRQVRAQMC